MVPANGGFTPQLDGNFKNHNEILNHWILAISSNFQTHPFTNYTKIVVEYGRMAVARFEPSHFDFDVGGPPSHLLWAVALYVHPNRTIPQMGVTWNLWNLDDPNTSFGIMFAVLFGVAAANSPIASEVERLGKIRGHLDSRPQSWSSVESWESELGRLEGEGMTELRMMMMMMMIMMMMMLLMMMMMSMSGCKFCPRQTPDIRGKDDQPSNPVYLRMSSRWTCPWNPRIPTKNCLEWPCSDVVAVLSLGRNSFPNGKHRPCSVGIWAGLLCSF